MKWTNAWTDRHVGGHCSGTPLAAANCTRGLLLELIPHGSRGNSLPRAADRPLSPVRMISFPSDDRRQWRGPGDSHPNAIDLYPVYYMKVKYSARSSRYSSRSLETLPGSFTSCRARRQHRGARISYLFFQHVERVDIILLPGYDDRMATRSYHQYCGIARALDLLGERWTLLLIRNLLLGPQRFKDLLEGLPGIGTNLLAARLRELESAGVIARRKMAPPASSVVYELTDRGHDLEDAVLNLARWGARGLGPPKRGEIYKPAWLLLSLRALFRPDESLGVSESYELQIDDEVFHAVVDDGTAVVGQGSAASPDLIVKCDARTFLDLAMGRLALSQAKRSGRIHLDGDARAFTRLRRMFAPSAQ